MALAPLKMASSERKITSCPDVVQFTTTAIVREERERVRTQHHTTQQHKESRIMYRQRVKGYTYTQYGYVPCNNVEEAERATKEGREGKGV